jgi:hypothetical protein
MSENLKAAAFAANLSGNEREQVDALSKVLDMHKTLLSMPSDAASKVYQGLPQGQKETLLNTVGSEDPNTNPNRGWLGTAWHYTGGQALRLLTAPSDFVTRIARTGLIAAGEGLSLGEAWTESGKDGEKKFNPGRIETARKKYGSAAVNVAMRIAGGETPESIMRTATEEEKYYLQIADKTNKVVTGLPDEKAVMAARDLFDDTIAAVDAAKYSPGRALANLVDAVIPGDFYEKGFFYKAVSGVTDAIWRLRTDPLLLASKAKKLYDINKYSLDVITGSARADGVAFNNYFDQEKTINFWNQYGQGIKRIKDARKADKMDEAAAARRELERLAPEFGPAAIKNFEKADVTDANSAKAFFLNNDEAFKIMDGKPGRQRLILPRLTPGRRARVNFLTGANRVFNMDEVGPELVDNMYFGAPTTVDGILKKTFDGSEEIAKSLKDLNKRTLRFSTAQIARRIDNAKRKFTAIPLFKNDQFDVTEADAGKKIYRLAAVIMPTREARLLAEVFEGTEEIGKRKEIFYGLWKSIADYRGINATESGQLIVRRLTGKGDVKFTTSRVDDYSEYPVLPSEMNTTASAPSLVDIDRASARSGFISRAVGLGNKEWVDKMTGAWSFLTLAGPRYAIRNSAEDLMVNLALGKSVWGLATDRYLATRLNTAISKAPGLTTSEKIAANPLGIMMRMINRKDAAKYESEIAGLEKQILARKEQLNTLYKDLRLAKTAEQKDAIQTSINDIISKPELDLVQETRKILARSLSEGRVNRVLAKMGLDPLAKESVDILSEQIVYGNIENFLAVVSEGGFNFASGSTYIDASYNLAKNTGVKMAELRLDLEGARTKYAPSAGSRGFKVIGLTDQNEASLVSWLLRISFYGNDELGALAISNLSDNAAVKAEGINKIRSYLQTDAGKKLMKEARLTSGKDMDELEYAQLVYNRAAEIFTKRGDGKLNLELLDKIRQVDDFTGEYKVTGKLSLDDVDIDINDMPESIVGPELVPVSDTSNYTSPLMEKGWVWLGLSTARMSRQPIALYEMVDIRKSMRESGFEKAFLDNFIKGIDPVNIKAIEKATEVGKRELATLVEERATANILAYVDNPLIRSQVAFGLRNFSRFYRAQEDFYRRVYRLVRYNPDAIQRIALTADGVAHNGWIQRDDRGELYFVYPHFTPGYKVIQGVLTALGVEQDFKVPFPVQFGGAVKMLTPSINPDSILPSFAGPAAALPLSLVENLVNVFSPGNGDTLTRYTLGKYAVDQPLVSRLMPSHVNRFLNTMDQDERNSQYASAYRKAVTYLEASGNGIPKKYDTDGNLIPPSAEELEEYRQKVRSTTIGVLATRFAFGFFAPASPSVQLKSDMADWIEDAGRANWKQAYNKLREEYGGDYDAAMRKWVELYPNQVPYTITESERKTVAAFGYAEESGKFVEENKALFKSFPEGAAFLIPHNGGFSFDAYRTMAQMGLRSNKRVEDYLRDVQTASDLQVYYDKKDSYERELELSPSPFSKTLARQQFNDWKARFLAGRPLVQEELAQGGQKAINRRNALSDLQNLLSSPEFRNVRPDVQKALAEMVNTYQQYQTQRDIFDVAGGDAELMRSIKESTISAIKQLATYNENTQAAYDVLFASLLGE